MEEYMTPKEVLKLHEGFLNQYEGDIKPTIIVCIDNTVYEPIINLTRSEIHTVTHLINGNENVDWAVFISTVYAKKDIENYEYGELSRDEEAREVNFMQVYTPRWGAISASYDKITNERLSVDEGEQDGYLSFGD